MNKFIPVNTPLTNGKEKEYLIEAIDTGWISSEGPFVQEFEKKFAEKVGRKFAVAVTSGSAALEVAISALGIAAGDEIILPTFTIISCAAPIVRIGAYPIVVDADPLTWNMDINQIKDKITSRTKAIMVVHIYGLPVDMDPVIRLAKKNGLKIIEDSAEALGLCYKGRACGSFGDVSTFSFYPNKLVTTGEGGMIATNDENIAKQCHSLRNLCFQTEKRFIHEELGWNFRMTNIQAALGLAQLERFEEFINKKRHMGKTYTERLQKIDGIQLPLEKTDYAENIYWVYGLVLEDDMRCNSEEIMKKLKEKNIGSRPFFWPLHEQPIFLKLGIFRDVVCPVAEGLARRGFYIPSGLGLKEEEIDRVSDAIGNILQAY